jgi:hemoglobin
MVRTALGGSPQVQRSDLSNPSQIHDLVTVFYREIVFDVLLEPVFSEVAEVDWAVHIPNLIDYWCWILLGKDGYPGAVTRTHRHLHESKPLTAAHCDRWYELWVMCVDSRWAGPYADHAKRHAAHLMAGMAKHVFGFVWQPPEPHAEGSA